MQETQRTYIAIDLKSFYASVECVDRVSKRHPQMSMWNRAAQFAPFAALTGYDEAIKEI
jgi:hypothetical protein